MDKKINNNTLNKKSIKKFALFGNPVEHSMSPDIYKFFSKKEGIQLKYKLINVSKNNFYTEIKSFFELKNSKGANITVPFKQEAVSICNNLTIRAKQSNSVNVIKKLNNGNLLGDNTDGVGLMFDLKKKIF